MTRTTPRTTLLGRLGGWCARRRWWVLAGWLAVLAGMVALGAGLGGAPSDDLSVPGLPAAEGACRRVASQRPTHFPGRSQRRAAGFGPPRQAAAQPAGDAQ
ncbi:MAG: hypothetical protein ACPHP1_04925, partial [Miltoncostaeaceae bacterium]